MNHQESQLWCFAGKAPGRSLALFVSVRIDANGSKTFAFFTWIDFTASFCPMVQASPSLHDFLMGLPARSVLRVCALAWIVVSSQLRVLYVRLDELRDALRHLTFRMQLLCFCAASRRKCWPKSKQLSESARVSHQCMSCRLCLEAGGDANELLSPCACRGSSGYVHAECLGTMVQLPGEFPNLRRVPPALRNRFSRAVLHLVGCLRLLPEEFQV